MRVGPNMEMEKRCFIPYGTRDGHKADDGDPSFVIDARESLNFKNVVNLSAARIDGARAINKCVLCKLVLRNARTARRHSANNKTKAGRISLSRQEAVGRMR